MDRAPLSVLVAASKWWPLSARLALAFVRLGCRVSAVCPAHHPLCFVAGIERVHRYAGIGSLASLHRALVAAAPRLVIPCDDGVVAQLHELHAAYPSLRALIERSLGSAPSFPIVRSRFALLMLARELGLPVPRTHAVSSEADLLAWHREISPEGMLKVDGETAGNGVLPSRSLEESLSAWRQLRAPMGPVTALKRLYIDRDPLAVWQSRRPGPRGLIVQEIINGRPANSMIACRDGVVLAMLSVIVVASTGATGAATIVRRIDNEPMRRAAQMLARHLRLNGFFGLDYVIDALTNTPYLVEMNPRCTQLGHLEFAEQASLAAALFDAESKALPGGGAGRGMRAAPVAAPIRGDLVALYPQALAGGPAVERLIAASHHDVPRAAPELLAELGLRPWPHRCWRARCYHRLRPLTEAEPMVFETLPEEQGREAAAGSVPREVVDPV